MTSLEDTKMEVDHTPGLDGDEDDQIFYLVSSSGDRVPVKQKFVKMSKVIANALEMEKGANELKMPQVGPDQPSSFVSTETVRNVVKYMEHHNGVQTKYSTKPLPTNDIAQNVDDPWDAQFLKSLSPNRLDLYSMTLAANFLDIKCLLHKCCAQVACLVKGRTLEQVKAALDPKLPHRADGSPDEIVPVEVKGN